jgi:penicillin G amidase
LSNTASYHVPALSAPVEILVDRWGVPHLYATSKRDVFVAQGFNAARDRLFQLDLWRRRGLGLLAEVFGADHVERDRAARLFVYRGDMHAEWLAYGSDTKQVTTAFVAGVNTYIDLCEQQPHLLPPEFDRLGYRPSRWAPSDVARIRSHGLAHNLEQEVARALTVRDYGVEVEDVRRVREPAHRLDVPEGLDLACLSEEVLRVYRLATTAPELGADAPEELPRTEPEGSNNWVLGPSKTATGRPILANDPHRAVGLPSLRYLAHLSAPGLDVIGAGEPALPGVSIGHNGHIAFGLTIFPIDQEDLYCYRTNPEDPAEYWYDGRWEPMRTVTEHIPVAGGEDRPVELQWTRHGPVIHRDEDRHTAFAVRTVWQEPGTAPYLGSIDYMGARSCEDFVAAMNRWAAPGENQIYADPSGTIGWRPAGLVPRRPNWDGTLPVPGDGHYEWDGFYDVDELPSEENPERGWIATANQMNLPTDYPNSERTVTYDWSHRYRQARIEEVLGDASGLTVADSLRLQSDYVNVAARRIVTILGSLTAGELAADPDAALGWSMLRDWDCDERASSPAAALYEVWHRRHLRPRMFEAVLAPRVPPHQLPEAVARISPKEANSGDMRSDLGLLNNPTLFLAAGTAAGADKEARAILTRMLVESLGAAVRETTRLLGPDTGSWRWGRLHRARFTHPAAQLLPPDLSWREIGPLPRGGSGNTVGNTNADANFRQTSGASFRIVIDVGDWDSSVAMNAPGQSGDPRSDHYDDLFASWAADESFPLLYSRAEVERHLDHRVVLTPEPS